MVQLLSYLLLLIIFSFLLIKATELLILSLNNIADRAKIGKFAITGFILALATSLPELFISVTAALEGQSSLAVGTILGSNIADISLVIGGAALIGGSIGVTGELVKKEIVYAFLAGIFPLILLLDAELNRVEGVLLLFIYGFYHYSVLANGAKIKYSSGNMARSILKRLNHRGTRKEFSWVFLGAALLIFSADGIVRMATLVARSFNMPMFLIGLFLVAVGTSLPELSFEIRAVQKKEVGMVFGDLLGSITANSTLILGIASLINPITLTAGLKPYFWATAAFLLLFFFFWLFTRTKKKLDRWEGLVLILIYFVFIFWEFWRFKQNTSALYLQPIP